MSARTKKILIGVLLIVVVAFVFRSTLKRSLPGRLVRFAAGDPVAVQIAQDLAEDVKRKRDLSELQAWSVEVLARFEKGQVATNGKASYWNVGKVKLADKEVPEKIRNAWSDPPEISVRISEDGKPECVVICWYLHGIVIGPPDYKMSFQPWCSVEPKPGIYTFHLYK